MFLLQAISAFVLGAIVVITRRLSPAVAGAVFLGATAVALVSSVEWSLFGFEESFGVPFATERGVESAGVLVLVLASALAWRVRCHRGARALIVGHVATRLTNTSSTCSTCGGVRGASHTIRIGMTSPCQETRPDRSCGVILVDAVGGGWRRTGASKAPECPRNPIRSASLHVILCSRGRGTDERRLYQVAGRFLGRTG
jgi:hypothetical protein